MERAEIIKIATMFVIFVAGIALGRITMAVQYALMKQEANVIKEEKVADVVVV